MAKQMFYCGKCDKVFTGQSMGINHTCPDCGKTLIDMHTKEDAWDAMSKEQQQKLLQWAHDKAVSTETWETENKGSNGWATFLRVVGWIIFAACVWIGAMFPGRIKLLTILAGLLVGAMSVAYTMVFARMGQDISAMRQQMEQQHGIANTFDTQRDEELREIRNILAEIRDKMHK